MKLRWFVTMNKDGLKRVPVLQYWNKYGYEETKDMNMYDLEEYAGEYGDLIVSSTNGEELLIMIDGYR